MSFFYLNQLINFYPTVAAVFFPSNLLYKVSKRYSILTLDLGHDEYMNLVTAIGLAKI
jgi:hypothetical protein